ncbi:MAG: AAC(3) family N-acetyltransferase [Pirellulaceae bacterium]
MRTGDVVFSHSNIGFLGVPPAGRDAASMCRTVLDAFELALGPSGTLVLPAFTYSWCKAQPFDPATTPSTCGARSVNGCGSWTERSGVSNRSSRSSPGSSRVKACAQVDGRCFGERSIWRLLDVDAIFANINLDAGATFLHFVERRLGVTYRYNKIFAGRLLDGGTWREGTAVYFCNDLSNPDTVAVFPGFHRAGQVAGTLKTVPAGRASSTGSESPTRVGARAIIGRRPVAHDRRRSRAASAGRVASDRGHGSGRGDVFAG